MRTTPIHLLVVLALAVALDGRTVPAQEAGGGAVDRSPKRIAELVARFQGEETSVAAQNASKALVEIGKPAVPALIEAAKRKDTYSRVWAAGTLGPIGDPRAKDAMLRLMDDPHPMVRSVTVWHSRRWFSDPKFREKTAAKLDDPAEDVRNWARRVFMDYERQTLTRKMREQLRAKDPVIRAEALTQLRALTPKEAYAKMAKDLAQKDESADVRGPALDILSEVLAKHEFTPVLIDRAENDGAAEIRKTALEQLKERLSADAYDKLLLGRLEKDGDLKIRVTALQALYKREDMKAKTIPILVIWMERLPKEWTDADREKVRKAGDKALSILAGQPFKDNPPPLTETVAQRAKRWRSWAESAGHKIPKPPKGQGV